MQFITSHSENSQFSPSELPRDLQQLSSKIEQQHYEALYEENLVEEASLETAIKDILDSFCSLDHSLCHSRYVWMAVLLSLTTKPTVEAYLQDDRRPTIVIAFTLIQLEQAHSSPAIELLLKRLKPNFEDKLLPPDQQKISISLPSRSHTNNEAIQPRTPEICISEIIETLFPKLSEGCQALDESLDVFRNVLKTLDHDQSQTALLNILDSCFEGYAIFPGSSGRRELFNWWLHEIIPASWYFQFPRYFYTIKGVQELETVLEGFFLKENDTALLRSSFYRSEQS